MSLSPIQSQSAPAEVSGWDITENFFVEKALLQTISSGRKRVALRTRLREGSLAFLRTRDDSSLSRSLPVAYRVARITKSVQRDYWDVELARLHPREVSSFNEPIAPASLLN